MTKRNTCKGFITGVDFNELIVNDFECSIEILEDLVEYAKESKNIDIIADLNNDHNHIDVYINEWTREFDFIEGRICLEYADGDWNYLIDDTKDSKRAIFHEPCIDDDITIDFHYLSDYEEGMPVGDGNLSYLYTTPVSRKDEFEQIMDLIVCCDNLNVNRIIFAEEEMLGVIIGKNADRETVATIEQKLLDNCDDYEPVFGEDTKSIKYSFKRTDDIFSVMLLYHEDLKF